MIKRLILQGLEKKRKESPDCEEIKNTIKLIKAISGNRFNWRNYQSPNKYWGKINVQTQPLFSSYGLIGFTIWGNNILNITHDWELERTMVEWKEN